MSEVTGYISETSKNRFTITAGILCVLFFLAQFVLPFVLFLFVAPIMMSSHQEDFFRDAEVERSAYWRGNVWYLESRMGGWDQPGSSALKRVLPGGDGEPELIGHVPFEQPSLLAGEKAIWVISPAGVGRFENGELLFGRTPTRLGDVVSKPFFHDGAPAVIHETPDGAAMAVYSGGDWENVRRVPMERPDVDHAAADMQILPQGDDCHIFRVFGSTLYYRRGLPLETLPDNDSWQSVCPAEDYWQATLIGGGPAVYRYRDDGRHDFRLEGLAPSEGNWTPFFSRRMPGMRKFAVLPIDASRFLILQEAIPTGMRIVEYRGDAVAGEKLHGGSSFFPGAIFAFMLIPHSLTVLGPILLALILSWLMSRHRVCEYVVENERVPYGSLARRAFAQVIDMLIFAAPFIAVFILMFSAFRDFDSVSSHPRDFPFKWMAVLALGGLAWSLFGFFFFSWTEGSYGWSPGKLVTGIRVVGTDLRPCGFGRALLRNLLKVVDGFFNFMVGVMVVALSENWQRVGDMAARTIIIRAGGRSRPPGWAGPPSHPVR